jgi:hypothetical protein
MTIPLLREIGLLLFIIYLGILLVGSILLFIKAKKTSKELGSSDIYGYCVALFFLFIAIGYIIRVEFMFFIAANDSQFFLQMTATERSKSILDFYANDGRLELLQTLWVAHMTVIFIGIGLLMFATEYKILNKRTKYFFTILCVAILPVIIFLPYRIAQNLFYISYAAPIAWLFIYINVARKATGSVRRNAIMLLVGFAIFVVGILFNSATVRRGFFGAVGEDFVGELGAIFAVWIAPVMLMGGFTVMLLALLNKF